MIKTKANKFGKRKLIKIIHFFKVKLIDKLSFTFGVASMIIIEFLALRKITLVKLF